MNLRRISLTTIAVIACLSTLRADDVRVVRLEVVPATKPEPPMRYRLFPSAREMQPGNAAALYYRAMLQAQHANWSGQDSKIADLLQLPPEKLPRDEAQKAIDEYRSALHETAIATRRDRVDWDIPVREDGISTQLQEIYEARALGRVLALKARLDALEGRYEAAIDSLETMIVLAQRIGEAGTLVSSLVGIAIVGLAADEIEHLAGRPGAPSLYWALTALPDPLIEVRKGFESEQLWLEGSIPHFAALQTSILSPQQASDLAEGLLPMVSEAGAPLQGGALLLSPAGSLLIPALGGYTFCKRRLISQGRDPAMVEAMPVTQVIVLTWVQTYFERLDEVVAFVERPDAEVRQALENLEKGSYSIHAEPHEYLARMLLPAVRAAKRAFTRQEQRVAVLRVIEALRLYAAAHDGRLPAQLAEIDAVPLPLDPAAGTPFSYELKDGTAILRPATFYEEVRYEITVSK